ncbi:Retrovirus-related Pol polyprotein, partial [Mucuna pruriens]
MATLPPRSIHTFSDLARLFLSQFAANKAKKMEVADLFDIKQARGESLKGYLARFNTATVRVNDPDQKFFVKAFQKGLRVGPFSDALALRRPASMEEIRMRAEKHIEVEEDQAERMEADHAHIKNKQVEQHHKPNHTKAAQAKHHFTPLTESRAKILKEICHTRLLKFPQEPEGKVLGHDKDEWCDFHRTRGHSTEACWTLCTQLERLVQEGRLNRYVHKRSGNSRRGTEAERRNQHLSNRGEGRRSRSRSRENIPVGHRGTIATISGGLGRIRSDGVRAMDVQECQTVLTGANATPLGRGQSGPVVTFDDRDLKLGPPTQDELMVISVIVADYKVERVLIDQGSSANILYWSAFEKMGLQHLNASQGALYGFAGECVPIKGTVELSTIFGEGATAKTIPVMYTVINAEASYNIIVGRPALNRLGAIVSTYHLCSVWADSRLARRCYEDSLKIGSGPLEPAVHTLDFDLDPRCIYEGERPHPAEDVKVIQIGPSVSHVTKVGTTLTYEEEEQLVGFLRRNRDVFAWTPQDMPGIDPNFVSHRLSIGKDAKPIAQKRRNQGEERRKAAKEETGRLLAADFIREVQYPTWLANVVMVKKPNGRWRMCTDYTDLNKACPKDPYSLPSIDRLVDGVSGYALLSFMDAYSSYNQIRMHPQDEEKTAFITESGAFCYRVMPFGLKNAGATYQRLMDRIFKEIMGVSIEVYVDDMVVKSTEAQKHCEALGRVFDILRRHQLRLNPEKCSFGVHAGKFLGFMLTERGIEANPDKCQAVVKMRSPRNVREVQQLMGRITALSRFISRLAETARPIFGTFKKAENFVWTEGCEEAFLRLKAMLASPPVLTRPVEGIPVHLYISVSDVTVSVVLVQEQEGNQRPIYFISKIEKAALALVIASRRLRPYFQNFAVIVKTDLPIRQVLRKPDLAGRMVAWSVQLSEFEISFERRGHIKAQALADFLTELIQGETDGSVEETNVGEWYLSVDDSSNHTGSGAGVILEGPAGIVIEQSLHFEFKASNNQAKYEALLAGMRLAQELEVKKLTAKSDSKLVTGQVNGEYQTKDPQLVKYWMKAKEMASMFENFVLVHVPRDHNERVDLLAKLASTQRRQQKSVIHESLHSPTIEQPEGIER